MPEQNGAIAIIPYDCFRWQPRVQFMETFKTRTAALNFAYQQGYNLIVERNEGRTALFDVLSDPDGVCTSGLELELLKTEDVLLDTSSKGWTALMLWTMWDLTKRLAAFVAVLYARQLVPLSRRAAVVAGTYLRKLVPLSRRFAAFVAVLYARQLVPLSRRAAVVAGTYLRQVVPLSRRFAAFVAVLYARKIAPASRRSATVASLYLRKSIPLSRHAAVVTGTYLREIAPRFRHAASRCWWSDNAVAFRRAWHRHSHGSVSDQAKRLGAELSCLYLREIAPRFRHAASRCRWSAIEGDFRRAWGSSLTTGSHLSRRFAATVVSLNHQQIVPFSRRAGAVTSMYLREIASIYRRMVAFANLYRREVAPILRSAATRCWSDSKSVSQPHSWAVAAPNHSNPSQLR